MSIDQKATAIIASFKPLAEMKLCTCAKVKFGATELNVRRDPKCPIHGIRKTIVDAK